MDGSLPVAASSALAASSAVTLLTNLSRSSVVNGMAPAALIWSRRGFGACGRGDAEESENKVAANGARENHDEGSLVEVLLAGYFSGRLVIVFFAATATLCLGEFSRRGEWRDDLCVVRSGTGQRPSLQ